MTKYQGHILVVDDLAMNRVKLSRFLQQQQHTVALAEHGGQAIEMLKEQSFDLMLLDIIMPEMDGYQVLAYLKQHDILRNLPVIVISAAEEMEATIKCIEMGADDYLPKPFDPVLLKARIGACLEKKRLRDQEVEYLNNVAIVTSAAAAVESDTFEPDILAGVALRQDELGRLARVFTNMVHEVQAREAQLKKARDELHILNEAKAKMIDHLSHELKTPLAIISASVKLLHKFFVRQNEPRFLTTLERINQYLQRLVELEAEANDIAVRHHFVEKVILDHIIQQCQDLLHTFVEERDPSDKLLEDIRQRVADLYLPQDDTTQTIALHLWIPDTLKAIQSFHAHRNIRMEVDVKSAPPLRIPEAIFYKIFRGIVRNAIEHTPDGGLIRIALDEQDTGLSLKIHDFGVGMDDQLQKHLFHGFIHASATKDYSSGNPYNFGAGGQGLDLLRTKLYAERLGFEIHVESQQCIHIAPQGRCPGKIQDCAFAANDPAICQASGGSLFILEFPHAMLGVSQERYVSILQGFPQP